MLRPTCPLCLSHTLLDNRKLGYNEEENMQVNECTLSRHDIYVADECFLTGTAAEIAPIVKVDDRVIGSGKPGSVTQKLHEEFHALVRS